MAYDDRPDLTMKTVAILISVYILVDSVGAFNGFREGQTQGEYTQGVVKQAYSLPPWERIPRIIILGAIVVWIWKKSNED